MLSHTSNRWADAYRPALRGIRESEFCCVKLPHRESTCEGQRMDPARPFDSFSIRGLRCVLMTHLRRVLAPVTAIWLCCQVGTVALVPVALWITAADPHGTECTCGHGLGAMCPMHHKPAAGSEECVMRAANSPAAAVLTSLVGVVGLIADPTRSIQPAMPSVYRQRADVDRAGQRPVPPDPPPPRA
jgi:hypothetical protein